jgi:hypothetical protein
MRLISDVIDFVRRQTAALPDTDASAEGMPIH